MMMWHYYLIGCVIGMWWMSLLIGRIFLQRISMPNRRYFSVLIAFPFAVVLSAFGGANGGDVNFLPGFRDYGTASVILVFIYAFYYESFKGQKES